MLATGLRFNPRKGIANQPSRAQLGHTYFLGAMWCDTGPHTSGHFRMFVRCPFTECMASLI